MRGSGFRHGSGAPALLFASTALACEVPAAVLPLPLDDGMLGALHRLHEERSHELSSFAVTSFDPSGGNFDLGFGPEGNSVRYVDDDGRFVIFDERGPGVVTRIWMTDLSVIADVEEGGPLRPLAGDIALFFDDEDEPRAQLPLADFFAGQTPPFLDPFHAGPAGSSGGSIGYFPLAYAERLKISTSEVVNYLQVGAYRVEGRALASFSPDAIDADALARHVELWRSTGAPIAGAPVREETITLEVPASGGASWMLPGPGVVRGLTLRASPAPAFLPDLEIEVDVDGEGAEIAAPWGDLFFAPLEPVTVSSRLVGHSEDGSWFLYLPMPFATRFALTLRGGAAAATTTSVEVRALVDRDSAPGELRLHAAFAESSLGPDEGDHILLDITGRGHVVGTGMVLCCTDSCGFLSGDRFGHLEGDERIFLDGDEQPALHGTGAEDYFNSAFYYVGGPYSRPTHGMPYVLEEGRVLDNGAFDCTTQYRLHATDPIPFREAIRFTLERGPTSDQATYFRSIVFYYQAR